MIYTIEFELPDNETVKKHIKYCPVHWQIWGYSGNTIAKPKTDINADTPQIEKVVGNKATLTIKDGVVKLTP